MKKIYYLQKHEIKLGDIVEYNGIKTVVTEELIELNPELFTVNGPMQELLDKAKRDYPAGTVFRGLFGKIWTVKNKPCYSLGAYNSILINDTYVYRDGRWAEILPLKFITEDGVSIYGDMKTYAICRDELILDLPSVYGGNSPTLIYFYHKENALAYIEKHREKTLKDYESILHANKKLLDYSSYYNGAAYNVSVGVFFHLLKANEPKLYYNKILQLIADDLNDGWITDFNDVNQCKYSLREVGGGLAIFNLGIVYFKSKELVEKARDILGDKVKYLFN